MKTQNLTAENVAPLSTETVAISHLSIPQTEMCSKWIRTMFGGQTIADTTAALILRRDKRLPVYCVPKRDVRLDMMQKTGETAAFSPYGTATFWTLRVGDKHAEKAGWSIDEPSDGHAFLADYMIFDWGKMDAWFEEDDQVFVHLKDPYHRIDVLNSSRHIRVVAGGKTVADTKQAALLYETGFPTRYYIPKSDVAMEFLAPSALKTRCPYKGIASSYWSIRTGDALIENGVWSYADPLPEAYKVKDRLCFYNEKVDAIYSNGDLVPKAVTPWS